jgi:hypothetical protein
VIFYFYNSRWNVENHRKEYYAKRSNWICVFSKLFLKSNIVITNDESDEQFFLVYFFNQFVSLIFFNLNFIQCI